MRSLTLVNKARAEVQISRIFLIYQKMAYGETEVSPLNITDYLVLTTKPDTNFRDIITVVDQHDQA